MKFNPRIFDEYLGEGWEEKIADQIPKNDLINVFTNMKMSGMNIALDTANEYSQKDRKKGKEIADFADAQLELIKRTTTQPKE